MILTLKNSSGVYMPLDIFEDFEVLYNHQYEDYKTVGAKKIPYTNKFKIPTTQNNRNLTGVAFDLTYPNFTVIEGKAIYEDGTTAFEFVCDVESQVTNVLEPYIEISIIDKISKALSDLSKYKLSDMVAGSLFNIRKDSWMFGDQSELTTAEKYWLFVYHNYNNRNALISHDPMRGLNQLQPTFILNKLVDKMFDYVGIPIVESDFLNLDDQLAVGIKANELGLTIPWKFQTDQCAQVIVNHAFSGEVGSQGRTDRVVGVPSQMVSSSRLIIDDFIKDGIYQNLPQKFNYDFLANYTYGGVYVPDVYGARYCSMVDGELTIRLQSNGTATFTLPTVGFGNIFHKEANLAETEYLTIDSVTTPTPPNLDVKLVNAEMERMVGDEFGTGNGHTSFGKWEQSSSYDIKASEVVGYAQYAGIVDNHIQYVIILDDDVTVKMDVKANQSLGLAYVLVPPNGDTSYTLDFNASDYEGGTYTWQMIIKEGYIEYKMLTESGSHGDDFWNEQTTMYGFQSGLPSGSQPANLTFDFEGFTDLPSGLVSKYNDTFGVITIPEYKIDTDINMSESFKAVVDYSLLDVLKMIMERYNLQLYSDVDGVIHIDSKANRASGEILIIDHLIDEGMEGQFSNNQNGILTVKDTNASFYEDDFNFLDKYSVNNEKREEVSLNFKSGIVNDKMFEDVYDDSAYDLLAWRGDSNSWGVADRAQKLPEDLKPTFCLLEASETPVYFPFNRCNYSLYIPDDGGGTWEEEGLDIGFYNEFFNGNVVSTSLKAVNKDISGFDMISFNDGVFNLNTNNLFQSTWYNDVMGLMLDDAVNITFEIYASENTMKILKDFPTISYKGQNYECKGFNKYPLSSKDGGLIQIEVIRI